MIDKKFRAFNDLGSFVPTKIEFDKVRKGDVWACDHWNCSELGESLKALVQYTGLRDRSGKEIYEDDIIQGVSGDIRYTPFKVVIPAIYFMDENGHVDWEVIGNIYQNPEILK